VWAEGGVGGVGECGFAGAGVSRLAMEGKGDGYANVAMSTVRRKQRHGSVGCNALGLRVLLSDCNE
jgi:hypothetical protein